MKRSLVVAAAALLLSTAGCGSIANFAIAPRGPRIYGGILEDVDMINGERPGGALGFLDFPLSLILDTATLPITLMCEIFGWRR